MDLAYCYQRRGRLAIGLVRRLTNYCGQEATPILCH
jgi:hypothetical protein